MGNCFSSFRAKFTPGNNATTTVTDDDDDDGGGIVLTDTTGNLIDEPTMPVLKVKNLDFCHQENGTAHDTGKFDLMIRDIKKRIVLRRGRPFCLLITFNRPYYHHKDGVSFIFTTGGVEKPTLGQGTLIPVPLLGMYEKIEEGWNARVEEVHGNNLKVLILTSEKSIVGEWRLEIDTKLKKNSGVSHTYSHKDTIFLLFNPWCKKDQVYIEKENHRMEYVLSDTGLIWRGSHNRPRRSVWHFAQFEADILQCALYLVQHIGHLAVSSRADCVQTVRAISAAVNSPDDDGVLEGKWSADFSGGTNPTEWMGSMKILQKYFKSKKPVKYGQCWVFAGVVTSICRALGIPCRPVTNFASAHDTQGSLTIDYFLDKDGKPIEELNSDSVWNYHVWNEVWMQRPDLEPGSYGGWQAIDATPQELSDFKYRCGPAPVSGVRRGEVQRPYDAAFVFAEVNADKVYWRYNGKNKPIKLINKQDDAIGKFVITKAIASNAAEDITLHYKFAERTIEEREVMLRALKQTDSSFSRYYLNDYFNDIKFDFELRDDITIGESFKVHLTIRNRNKLKDHHISVTMRVESVYYTGKVKDTVKTEKSDNMLIKAGAKEELSITVTYFDYAAKLVDQGSFNIACLATVQETNFEYFVQDDFRVRKPDIEIAVDPDITIDKEFIGTAGFRNPLPVALRKGMFIIEGPGLGKPLHIKTDGDVKPKEFAIVPFKMTPQTIGEKTIGAKFISKELEDVDGYVKITVSPKKELNGHRRNSSNRGSSTTDF